MVLEHDEEKEVSSACYSAPAEEVTPFWKDLPATKMMTNNKKKRRHHHREKDADEDQTSARKKKKTQSTEASVPTNKKEQTRISRKKRSQEGVNESASDTTTIVVASQSSPVPRNFPSQQQRRRRLILPPHRYVLAPMVGASELPFRLLCRKYGAQLCYTPMLNATKFVQDANYRQSELLLLPTTSSNEGCDRPLTVHFAANNPDEFAAAAATAESLGCVDAVDLNLGCPQRTAYVGHFGSYLLDETDRPLILAMVAAACRATEGIPICAKIRLLPTIEQSVRLCQQLCQAGASIIAIHARQRASWERTSASARDGPADLQAIRHILQRALQQDFPHAAVIANGNTVTYQDVVENLQYTGAHGIMSAEGILDNPALFLPRYGDRGSSERPVTVWTLVKKNNKEHEDERHERKKRKLLKKIGEIEILEQKSIDCLTVKEKKKLASKQKRQDKLEKLLLQQAKNEEESMVGARMEQVTVPLGSLYDAADDKLRLAYEYLDLAAAFPVPMRSVIFHIRRMLKPALVQYQLLDECLSCESVHQLRRDVLRKISSYRLHPQLFVYDSIKAKAEKDALERKRREENKRQAYEARMIRKAKREGKSDWHYYLKMGAELPSVEKLQEFKAMSSRQDMLALWKKDHSQHCLSFHLDEGGCQRGRACAFLHVDVSSTGAAQNKNAFVEQDEVAG